MDAETRQSIDDSLGAAKPDDLVVVAVMSASDAVVHTVRPDAGRLVNLATDLLVQALDTLTEDGAEDTEFAAMIEDAIDLLPDPHADVDSDEEDEDEVDAMIAAALATPARVGSTFKDPKIVVPMIKVLATQLLGAVQGIIATKLPELEGDAKAISMAAIDLGLAVALADEEMRPGAVRFLGRYLEAQGQEILDSIAANGIDNPPPDRHLQ